MELLVLGTLDWRMRSVTPFSFLSFFISFFSPARPPLLQALKAHATQILLKAKNGNQIILPHKSNPKRSTFSYIYQFYVKKFVQLLELKKNHSEIKMLEFKPSVVAASSLLSAAYEIFPIQFPAFRAAVSSCNFVNEVLHLCFLCFSSIYRCYNSFPIKCIC